MKFLNIGHKDELGKQRQIEHRGKYLRASRTGGVALRAQARALEASLTANTQRGFRVSTTPMKNTQVALQNGRFVLRGRYGSGPFRFNLSQTGVSASVRNRLGSFNLLKPQKSSAKIFGIQLRGKNAAGLQVVYMAVAGAVTAVGLIIQLLAFFVQVLDAVLSLIYRLILASPYVFRTLLRKIRNKRITKQAIRLEEQIGDLMNSWTKEQLTGAALLVLTAWGRGQETRDVLPELERLFDEHGQKGLLERSRNSLTDVAQVFENLKETHLSGSDLSFVTIALIARRLPNKVSDPELAEVVLQADELALHEGKRTVLQVRMLEVLADFAGLQFYEEEEEPAQDLTYFQSEEGKIPEPEPEPDTAKDSADRKIDLNSASFET